MNILKKIFTWIVLLLGISLPLSACGTIYAEVETVEITENLNEIELGGVEDPNVFIDSAAFQAALLDTLTDRDAAKLQTWMTEPFFTGTWRADLTETSPAEAVKTLFTDHLGADNRLTLVKDTDLKALIGGKERLPIPGGELDLTKAFLVGGLGNDGSDEAILFVSRQADNSFKLNAWMVIKGGFSGARIGGVQPYNNFAQGYSLFFPKGYEITTQTDGNVVFIGPGEGHNRGLAYIALEPSNGRTTDQVVEAVKAELGEGFNIISTTIRIEDTHALVVTGLPGQDSNRQIFMVRNDLLYHLIFAPDDPQIGEAYQQMEDLYAMIVNTFHFT